MKFTLFIWLLVPLAASGAHTMAWEVPLHHLVGDGLDNPGCKQLEEPPADSAFFRRGDELWDVSSVITWDTKNAQDPDPFASAERETHSVFPGEWLIWNATTERLVAHGSWAQLNLVEHFIELDDLHALARLELQIIEDQDEPRSLSILTRSGEKSSFKTARIDLECEINAHLPGTVPSKPINVIIDASWTREGGRRDGIELHATVLNGDPITVARWQDDQGAWEARITCTLVTVAGTPTTRLRQIETPGGIVWPDERPAADRAKPRLLNRNLENGLMVRSVPTSRRLLQMLGEDRAANFPDLKYQEAKVFPGSGWINITEAFRGNGVKLSAPGAVVGFHSVYPIVTAIGEPADIDMITQFLLPGPQEVFAAEFSLDTGSDTVMIRCASGTESHIFRTRNGKSQKLFTIAGSIGASHRLIDARYAIAPNAEEHLKSATTLVSGVPQKVSSSTQNGPTTLTGTVRSTTP